ncbi:hypothetical protein ACTD5D_08885 [Nocardia takedensis]|uniref:hypothetical protein n=1 Tax=Nocardia takedensis TaxID=259390 RepID=UPI0002D33AF7|nr:hypothetical protein [Nocardia takedensis]
MSSPLPLIELDHSGVTCTSGTARQPTGSAEYRHVSTRTGGVRLPLQLPLITQARRVTRGI